jgi:hypothetical protein
MSSPSERPTTRTYSGGSELPALTDEFQRVHVGKTPTGEYAPEQRAFLVSITNRSEETMEVREGDGDAIKIGPYESYKVTDLSGRNYVELRGPEVGEEYEIKSVEAHNEFSFTDRLEAFVQSVSILFETSGQVIQKSSDVGVDNTDDNKSRSDDNFNDETQRYYATLEAPAGQMFDHRLVEYYMLARFDETFTTNNADAMEFRVTGSTTGDIDLFEAVWETDPNESSKWLRWRLGEWWRSDNRGTLKTTNVPGGWRLGPGDQLTIEYSVSIRDFNRDFFDTDFQFISDWRYDTIDV